VNEFPTLRVAAIGAAGGFALSILKLIEAKFFVDAPLSGAAIGAYLSYAGYMLLGSLAATFLSDHELSYPKLRRSAFMFGLAAPSILFALTTQTLRPAEPLNLTFPTGPIPSLTHWLPIGTALAQQSQPPLQQPKQDQIFVLPESALKPSLAEGFAAAWGRGTIQPRFAYVVGRGSDKAQAVSTAKTLTDLLAVQASPQSPPVVANVVKIENGDDYFVVLGSLGSKEDVAQTWIKAQKAMNSYAGPKPQVAPSNLSEEQLRSLIQRVRTAPVISATELLTK